MDGAFGSGVYKCEITIETPRFVTLELRKNVTVIGRYSTSIYILLIITCINIRQNNLQLKYFHIVPPPKEPRIIGMAQTYKVGNIVEVTCKSKDSKPAPRIQWLVNKENVSKE